MANYQFVDTNEVSEGAVLPSEALKINGEYIENLIPGYRTLQVSGREALSPDVVSYETGLRDGSRLKNKRFPERIITIKYQLIAESNEAFREAFNKLGGILNVEDAELVFNDEQDKFFIGTPCFIGEVEPGKNAVIGEIEILCVDPFKYSVLEYEAEASLDETSVLIDYGGTYKAYPTLEADFYAEEDTSADDEREIALTGAGDCGFVAFFTEDEKIIQLGDPDEENGENNAYEKSQTLVNKSFDNANSFNATSKVAWAQNVGVVAPNSLQKLGIAGMKVASTAVAASAGDTSGTLLNEKVSTASTPHIYYTIKAKATNRTASSVKVDIAITTRLRAAESYFGTGYGLKGSVYIGGAWRDVTIKSTSAYWRGNSGHTVNLSVTVSGLSATTDVLAGVKFKATRTDGLGQAGTLGETACNNLKISTYTATVPASYYLAATSYGVLIGKWHGVTITRTIPADAAGAVGSQNFTLTYKQRMSIGEGSNDTKQLGAFQANLTDANGVIVAGVRVLKSAAGRNANIHLYVNGNKVETKQIDISYNNKYFGAKAAGTSTITKFGDKVTFNIAGHKATFTDGDIADLVVTKITFAFEQYSSNAALTHNGLYSVKFVKNNCQTFKNVPNKFGASDVLEADCKTGQIYLNGAKSPELGALGNDWEGFYLTPGLNQIGLAYSAWVPDEYKPSFKVRYREVFL